METNNQSNKMQVNTGFFSGMGGVIAIVSILFLPIIGCGGDTITGVGIFKSNQVSSEIKLFIGIAVLMGLVLIFLRKYLVAAITGIAGLVSLLIAYSIAHSKIAGIELKFGAFFAMIGFAISSLVNFLKMSNTEDAKKL
ncbi:hypothetical protein CJD36_004410 [Flavipsychrobacter stenotrophus]|uniref:Uncharacterized protein n=1 Tax=Flavipsychrobacter stenotrophus TaxID=2077091 RepID=A0A2S7T1A2_9BACT|nr:hypothetical protein [Flavipsychrobacter stenotrophus]PQJ12993.1 hypothetical protein CJD36_004410 [Flavipsychrobacter stenotrophus]